MLILNQNDKTELLSVALKAAWAAGHEIMAVYGADLAVEWKADQSPLTEADRRAHDCILKHLWHSRSDLPVLSEESADIPLAERQAWTTYWLVDPLDGTKEFLKRNDEFTVNIALVHEGQPVAGVVYAPALKRTWVGATECGAYRLNDTIYTTWPDITQHGHALPLAKTTPRPLTVVASRSHRSPETDTFIDALRGEASDLTLLSAGSALKLCLVAEGSADVYPRFAPTMEWDTAAGHAVCAACGVSVTRYPEGDALAYNKENLLNPWFLVDGRKRKASVPNIVATNITWDQSLIDLPEREKRNKHRALCCWLTGLSGSGKSTISRCVERALFEEGVQVFRLDGDNVRHGLCADLGFSREDRMTNIRRIGHAAKLLYDAGHVVICAFISPYEEDRRFVRALFPEGGFHEMYVACDLETCKQRDPKGLYAKAERGEIKGFTGIDDPYEAPAQPELIIDTTHVPTETSVQQCLCHIRENL